MEQEHSQMWSIVLTVLGVTYFTAWSISFYPQLILNYQRKSAKGLSFDFSILNPLGFLCYTIYALFLSFDPISRREYGERNEGNKPQVSMADRGFAIHAFVLSALGLVQVLYYGSRGKKSPDHEEENTYQYGTLPSSPDLNEDQELSTQSLRNQGRREHLTRWGKVSLVGITLVLIVQGGLLFADKGERLDFIYTISYIKLYISIAKWLPQLYLNHTLRSTTGFSLPVVILDLIGSFTSFAELVISSWLANDLSGIWGNPLKLGLSGVTVLMDGWFIGQRLVFGQKEGADGGEGERERLLRDGR